MIPDCTSNGTPRLRGSENCLFQKGLIASVSRCVVAAGVASLLCASTAAAQETISEIRVHGNHTTPDVDIISLAKLAVGDPASEGALQQAERRLQDSGRFDAVEVRRRYRSISDPSEVLVILLVDERAAIRPDDLMPGPIARVKAAGMWLPILNARDGYGLTYGARIAIVKPLGTGSRVSMPLTWGGERRAALEVERTFDRGPLTTARGTVAVYRHVNPHFSQPDTRREVSFHTDRLLARWLRAGADARVAQVTFGGTENRHTAGGAHLILDTRLDPSFPRNAVHATVGWEGLAFRRPEGLAGRRPEGLRLPSRATVVTTDVRGYVGIGGSAVLALRARASRASAALPASEQSLLGGSESLRGYRAGHRAGDSLAALSAEARLPLTSPLNYGRFGVKALIDAGTTWDAGERLASQRFDRGIGGGVYFGATAVTGNLDVAWPRQGKPRVHVGFGVTF